MTNKIKPFCVNVQDIDGKGTVATEQQIRDLHKMCIQAGAVENESVEYFVEHREYDFKGVDNDNETFTWGKCSIQEFNSNILHLDQVPAHLGLESHKEDTDLEQQIIGLRKMCMDVCTVKKFQTYCEEQRLNSSVNNTLSDDNSPEDESPSESVKPLKWTVCAQKQGIPLQVGMTCVDNLGIELEVKYLGDKLAIVIEVEDDRECSATVDSLLPFPKELSPEEEQREKVMTYLLTEFDEEDSEIIYDNLLKLGVFKF